MRQAIHLLLATCLLTPAIALAEMDVDGIEELLPHHETDVERLRWSGIEHTMPERQGLADPPPNGPIRGCGEWESVTGVLIRYPLGLPYELLRDMDDEVTLHVIVRSGLLAAAQSNLAANGVDMGRVEFLVEPNDSIWTRDYGPWFVFDGDGALTIVDHVYNRPFRPNDNLIPVRFGAQQSIPVVSHDMWHTGGNYMTDGAHVSSSTQLVYNEAAQHNGMSESEVDQLMDDYYGVDQYDVLDYIEAGGIHHIDTWAKFLDQETVLVKEVWPSHHTYAALEQRATLLASLQASTGRNYRVHRVYCYDIGGNQPASYTNSLFLNENVYVPTFGDATHDAAALAAYEDALPGYVVRGYFYSGWLTDDALHCRAKGVMDAEMLRVVHVPVRDPQQGAVILTASIEDYSERGITAQELHYRHEGGGWVTVPLTPAGGDAVEGVIPQPVEAGVTDYYLHAESASGRTAGSPRVAPAHWHTFEHQPATTAVDVATSAPARVAAAARPNPFRTRTTFTFELAYEAPVTLDVYDVQGRRVRRLLERVQAAGNHEVAWDGLNDAGRELAAGVYFFRLRAAGISYRRPVVLAP